MLESHKFHKKIHFGEVTTILFKSITMLCGSDNILQNIPHIKIECDEYRAKYYQSHRTLL